MITNVSSSTTSLTISWALGSGLAPIDYTLFYQNTNTECFNDTSEMFSLDINQTMYSLEGLVEGSEYLIKLTLSIMCEVENIVEESVRANTAAAG